MFDNFDKILKKKRNFFKIFTKYIDCYSIYDFISGVNETKNNIICSGLK